LALIEVSERRKEMAKLSITAQEQAAYARDGYSHLKQLRDGKVAAILRFNFTWGLMVGVNPAGYERRYCYEYSADAARALEDWDGKDHPDGPWIKCKGVMPNGQGVDLLNPNIHEDFVPSQRMHPRKA
jgi:hypothetical protein